MQTRYRRKSLLHYPSHAKATKCQKIYQTYNPGKNSLGKSCRKALLYFKTPLQLPPLPSIQFWKAEKIAGTGFQHCRYGGGGAGHVRVSWLVSWISSDSLFRVCVRKEPQVSHFSDCRFWVIRRQAQGSNSLAALFQFYKTVLLPWRLAHLLTAVFSVCHFRRLGHGELWLVGDLMLAYFFPVLTCIKCDIRRA